MNFVYGENLSLDTYLRFLKAEYPNLVPNNRFPSEEMLKEFLNRIEQLNDNEVKDILRCFFIKNCTFEMDILYKETYKTLDTSDSATTDMFQRISETEYYKRLIKFEKKTDTVWEGLTWILELLPNFPNEALRALRTYFLANCQYLPDSYIGAFGEWAEIIRTKYVDYKTPLEIFLNIDPIDFEYLISYLYTQMGYETTLTKRSGDGGIDVIATKQKTGKKEKLLIQCKRHRGTIGTPHVMRLLGVVSNEKATKGVLVTSSGFSKHARDLSKSNSRIELLGRTEISKLLNLHLGPNWPNKIDQYVMYQK